MADLVDSGVADAEKIGGAAFAGHNVFLHFRATGAGSLCRDGESAERRSQRCRGSDA